MASVASLCWNGKHSMAMAIIVCINVPAIVGNHGSIHSQSVLRGYFMYSYHRQAVSIVWSREVVRISELRKYIRCMLKSIDVF